MPSASAKLEKQASIEANDPLKQITTMVEKKVRNLEKRKAKLDAYRNESQHGKELNEDQKKAIEKYDQVVEVLEFAKEMQKSFNNVVQETSKLQKKVAKREYLERQQQELQRIKEIMMIQDILNSMGGDVVRNDFLNGTNGAVKLTEEELNSLDELFKLICPERDMTSPDSSEFEKQLLSAAEHLQSLLDSKNKEVIGTTYKVLKDTILKIHSCNYFNKSEEQSSVDQESNEATLNEPKESTDNFTEGEMQTQYAFHHATDVKTSVDEPHAPVECSFYQSETPYQDQNRPIQEVLPVQGNLNFLQESQIDLESPQLDQSTVSHTVPSGYSSNFVSASQASVSQGLASPHFQQRPKEEANLPAHIPPAQVLPSSVSAASVQPPPHSTGLSFSGSTLQVQNSTTAPADFDPNRPIPTQTYTNQSFSTAIHPMMAAAAASGVAVPQNFVTLTHAIPSQHILPATIVAQSVPQRSISTSSSGVLDPSTMPVSAHSQPAGMPVSSSVSKMSLTTHDAKEHFVNRNFHLPQVSRESHQIGKTTTGSSQFERVNAHEGYQSTNNSQSYMGHENFPTDNSSYSSNLKRGLTPRGVARGSGGRGGAPNPSRGNRSAYRNQ